MRKLLFILVLITITSINSSCKKDSNGSPVIPGITNSMSAKINGIDWSSIVRSASINGNMLSVSSTSITGESIQVTITPDNSNANLATNVSYTLSLTTFYKKTVTASTDDAYFAVSGTAKLSQLDLTNKLISGTFSFNATSINLGNASITAGEFTNISFISF